MKLLNKIVNSRLVTILRNNLGIKQKVYYYSSDNSRNLKNSTISDSFCWRTDNGYETKFKFSDIHNFFFETNSNWVEIEFFDKRNKFLKKIQIDNLDLSNEILINQEFFNGLKDYGTFYIYHFTNDKKYLEERNQEMIVNRCYVGYSLNKNLFSFVHGNTVARYKKNHSIKNEYTDIVCTSFLKNNYYKIQKFFGFEEKHELIFTNPTSKKIKFTVNKIPREYSLNGGCSELLELKDIKEVSIKSNCLWLRPLIFSYKKNYIDVHHS